MITHPRHTGNNLEARARALAERALRGSYVGNAKRHAEMSEFCGPKIPMPKLLTDSEIMAEVDRDWPIYAEIIMEAES